MDQDRRRKSQVIVRRKSRVFRFLVMDILIFFEVVLSEKISEMN